MHRLFTSAALIVSGLLISISADAGPGAGPHVRVFNGTSSSAGESVEPKHKDWINLNKVVAIRWAPGVVSRNVHVRGRIQLNARGEPKHGALQILKQVDKASPLLARAAKTGQPLPKVILISTGKPQAHEGGTITIIDSTISGHQTNGSAGKAKEKEKKVLPMESISLNF